MVTNKIIVSVNVEYIDSFPHQHNVFPDIDANIPLQDGLVKREYIEPTVIKTPRSDGCIDTLRLGVSKQAKEHLGVLFEAIETHKAREYNLSIQLRETKATVHELHCEIDSLHQRIKGATVWQRLVYLITGRLA